MMLEQKIPTFQKFCCLWIVSFCAKVDGFFSVARRSLCLNQSIQLYCEFSLVMPFTNEVEIQWENESALLPAAQLLAKKGSQDNNLTPCQRGFFTCKYSLQMVSD